MEDDDFISKTRRKRQMHDLQAIGAALVKLSPESLSRLDLPEALREAVLAAQRFTKHEARREHEKMEEEQKKSFQRAARGAVQ